MASKNPPAASGQKAIKSLGKAIDVIFAFTRERPSLTVEEISRVLGFPRSSTYRLIATLREKGVVRQKAGSGSYMLGTRLLQLGDVIRLSLDLRHTALPFMQKLVGISRETVVLVVPTDSQATYLEMLESPEPMRVIPSDGMSFPLHCGSTRRILLAFMSPEFQESYLRGRLRRFSAGTLVDKTALRSDLAQIRKRGYATSNQEIYAGARSLAVPVRDAADRVIASLGIVGPVQRLTDPRLEKLLPSLLECAEGISIALGARPKRTAAQGESGSRQRRNPSAVRGH